MPLPRIQKLGHYSRLHLNRIVTLKLFLHRLLVLGNDMHGTEYKCAQAFT